MKRREFIVTLGAAAAAWPFAARAQQPERLKRIGVLSNAPADAQGQSGVEAFQQALRQLGWSDGSNVRIDVRWGEK
jgi:putative ABC transport system substrate-binding protein